MPPGALYARFLFLFIQHFADKVKSVSFFQCVLKRIHPAPLFELRYKGREKFSFFAKSCGQFDDPPLPRPLPLYHKWHVEEVASFSTFDPVACRPPCRVHSAPLVVFFTWKRDDIEHRSRGFLCKSDVHQTQHELESTFRKKHVHLARKSWIE